MNNNHGIEEMIKVDLLILFVDLFDDALLTPLLLLLLLLDLDNDTAWNWLCTVDVTAAIDRIENRCNKIFMLSHIIFYENR